MNNIDIPSEKNDRQQEIKSVEDKKQDINHIITNIENQYNSFKYGDLPKDIYEDYIVFTRISHQIDDIKDDKLDEIVLFLEKFHQQLLNKKIEFGIDKKKSIENQNYNLYLEEFTRDKNFGIPRENFITTLSDCASKKDQINIFNIAMEELIQYGDPKNKIQIEDKIKSLAEQEKESKRDYDSYMNINKDNFKYKEADRLHNKYAAVGYKMVKFNEKISAFQKIFEKYEEITKFREKLKNIYQIHQQNIEKNLPNISDYKSILSKLEFINKYDSEEFENFKEEFDECENWAYGDFRALYNFHKIDKNNI